jgi:hypothetical protein
VIRFRCRYLVFRLAGSDNFVQLMEQTNHFRAQSVSPQSKVRDKENFDDMARIGMSAHVKPDDRRVLSDIVDPLASRVIPPEVVFNAVFDELDKGWQCCRLRYFGLYLGSQCHFGNRKSTEV